MIFSKEEMGGRRAPPAQQHPDFFSCLGGMIGNASLSAGTVALGNFWAANFTVATCTQGKEGIGFGIRQRSTGRTLMESFIKGLAREDLPSIASRSSTRGLSFLFNAPRAM